MKICNRQFSQSISRVVYNKNFGCFQLLYEKTHPLVVDPPNWDFNTVDNINVHV